MAAGDRQLYVTPDVKLVMNELNESTGISTSFMLRKMIEQFQPLKFDTLLKRACKNRKIKYTEVIEASRDKRSSRS